MKRITLERFVQNELVTFGKMHLEWVKDHPDIYTLELPWRNNERMISCVPRGIYNAIPHNSAKWPNTWQILTVPNRTAILIHVGNYVRNTDGCILPGFGIDESIPMVQRSGNAMRYLRQVIGKDNFSIEITD